jgi:exodeoxyribonuclease III
MINLNFNKSLYKIRIILLVIKMKLISWNVNGIRAAVKKGFLDFLEQENPDILCIQESKAHKEQLKSEILSDHGYFNYWHSGIKKGYSGVAIFSKKEPLYIQEGLGIKKYDDEGRVLIAEYENFLLYNIYFPNGQKDDIRLKYKLDFYDDLLPIINDQVESGNNVIVTGDWNTAHKPIDLARPKQNVKTSGYMPIERQKIDTYIENGWIDTFRLFHDEGDRYSWWSYRSGARPRNIGWRIDYFFVNKGIVENCLDADIYQDVLGSDHCPVSLELEF